MATPNRRRAGQEAGPLAVTVVHGTYARGRLFATSRPWFGPASDWWFRPGSKFRVALEASLLGEGREANVQEHDWSGANTIAARAQAAKALTEAVAARHRGNPADEQVLVAHSHGGNVAMRAADALHELGIRVRVVTLATPYLRVAQRSAGWPHFTLFLLCMPLFVWPLAALDVLLAENVPGWSSLNVGGLLAYGALYLLVMPWFSWMEGRRKRLVEAVNFNAVRSGRVLVLRGFVDEATLALAFGAIGAELMHFLLIVLTFPVRLGASVLAGASSRVGRPLARRVFGTAAESVVEGVLPWLMFAGFVSVVGLLISVIAPVGGAGGAGGRPAFAWYILPLIGLSLLTLSGAAFALHGRELFLHALGLMVTADSVPDSLGKLDVVTLDLEAARVAGLRHGLFNHPDCASLVARWICHGRL